MLHAVLVRRGTNRRVKPGELSGNEVEYVLKDTVSSPKNVCVFKGTDEEVDPNDCQKDKIEYIAKDALKTLKKIYVKNGTAEIVESDDSEGECVSRNTYKYRKRKLGLANPRPQKRARKETVGVNNAVDANNSVSQSVKMEEIQGNREKIKAISPFNLQEVEAVIQILRGPEQTCDINCLHFAADILKYFISGELPTKPSEMRAGTSDFFNVHISEGAMAYSQDFQIKSEDLEMNNGVIVPIICESIVDRSSELGRLAPAGIDYLDENDSIDLTREFVNVETYRQQIALHKDLNQHLMSLGNVSIGYVCLARCGPFIDLPGHIISYYTTKDAVYYQDPQLPKPIFTELAQAYEFVGTNKKIEINTFSDCIFYTPVRIE
jgi:hypothetical protein